VRKEEEIRLKRDNLHSCIDDLISQDFPPIPLIYQTTNTIMVLSWVLGDREDLVYIEDAQEKA